MEVTRASCARCGTEFAPATAHEPPGEREPCHACGSTARVFAAAGSVTARVTASVKWTHIRETVERHRRWVLVSLAIGAMGATAGYFLAGTMPGIVVALAVAVAGTWARGRTVTRVRHVERG